MSAEVLKQLKIKTSTLRRLKKEYISYEKETKTINSKIETLEASPVHDEDIEIEIKKNVSLYQRLEIIFS